MHVCLCVCAHVCLFVFVSSVNYLQHWQCLSIVDGNGKYVSLWLFLSGNSIQHLSAEKKKTLLQSHLITHMCFLGRAPEACGTMVTLLSCKHVFLPRLIEIGEEWVICSRFDKWEGEQVNYCSQPTCKGL